MRIILVGAPGSGKTNLAKDYQVPVVPDIVLPKDLQVGDLADYRTELWIAIHRAFDMESIDDGIFMNTLVDNVAYSSMRVARLNRLRIKDESLERWLSTSIMITQILLDSFRFNEIVFVPGNDGSDFGKELEVALKSVLDEARFTYKSATV